MKMKLKIDEKVLIEEIQKRPCLYDNRVIGYADVYIRKQEWAEVYNVCIENWNEMTLIVKSEAIMEVQKRWKNLRTCFARELKAQRDVKYWEPGSKRKKYYNFDRLLFLLPIIGNKKSEQHSDGEDSRHSSEPPDLRPIQITIPQSTSTMSSTSSASNTSSTCNTNDTSNAKGATSTKNSTKTLSNPKSTSNGNDTSHPTDMYIKNYKNLTIKTNPSSSVSPTNGISPIGKKLPVRKPRLPRPPTNTNTITNSCNTNSKNDIQNSVCNELLEVLKDRKESRPSTLDEDTHFVMSLIPYLRKIPFERKLETQIGILSVIQDQIKIQDPLLSTEVPARPRKQLFGSCKDF